MNNDQSSKCLRQIDAQMTSGQHKSIKNQSFMSRKSTAHVVNINSLFSLKK